VLVFLLLRTLQSVESSDIWRRLLGTTCAKAVKHPEKSSVGALHRTQKNLERLLSYNVQRVISDVHNTHAMH